MFVAVVPACSRTARAIIQCLLNKYQPSCVRVRGLYKNISCVPHEFRSHPNFEVTEGDASNATAILNAASSVDAILAIVTAQGNGDCCGSDILQWTKSISKHVRLAVQRTVSIKRIVLLSSMQIKQCIYGVEENMARHVAEEDLRDAASEVVFVRCAFLMENWAHVMETVNSEAPSFYSLINTSWDYKVPMVSLRDVAQVCASQLIGSRGQSPNSINVFEVLGPRSYTIEETLNELQKLTGRELEVQRIGEGDSLALPGQSLKEHSVESFFQNSSIQQIHTHRGQTELSTAIQKLYEKDIHTMTRPFEVPVLRGVSRNIHIFDGRGSYLGGGYQNEPRSITAALFYDMCGHFLVFPNAHPRWHLFTLNSDNAFGQKVRRSSSYIEPGNYVVLGNQAEVINVGLIDERPVRRIQTPQEPTSRLRTNQAHFRDTVRLRDGVCAISGRAGLPEDPWFCLIAGHIYPVAQLHRWRDKGHFQWITDTTDPERIGPDRIFSAQNGILLELHEHLLFDKFKISVSPDHGHKVICFTVDTERVTGCVLSATTRPTQDSNLAVSDNVLRWHFHQSVLTNMKGAGERMWDLDPAGGDPMNTILADSDAAEIMEVEMGNRLGPYVESMA